MSEDAANSVTSNPRFKRKRKKSFLKNARKYGKKGYYGRGSHLEPDTYHYFIRIMETYREGFATDEDKSIFVNNVFEQTQDQEINCCCNQVGCRVVELLLPFANDTVLDRFMQALGAELRPLCSDRFASHVLEALITQAATRSSTNHQEFVLKVTKFLLNNLEDYLWDTYANHVIRTCVGTLAQIPKLDKAQTQPVVKAELPGEHVEIIKDFAQRIVNWPQFSELSRTEITSGFLQVLLRALRKADKKMLSIVLEQLISKSFTETDSESLPGFFLSTPSVMLLETMLEVAKRKKFTKIFLHCFVGKLVKVATTRSTNFTVQKLITNCRDKFEFETIFDELSNSFKDIITAGHTGIIWGLADGCKRFLTKQGTFVNNLMKSLDCFQPEERQNQIVLCLCKFTNYESIQDSPINLQKDKLSLHGTLIVQTLLNFNKPIKIVNSILSMEQNDLLGLLSNSMGSHITDSYAKSEFVGEKSREKLIRKMKGVYQDLASSKYGSRSFEAVWHIAGAKNKLAIMEELTYKDGLWINSEFGKIVSNKINLLLYKRNKSEWMNSLNTVNKTEQLFKDIVK